MRRLAPFAPALLAACVPTAPRPAAPPPPAPAPLAPPAPRAADWRDWPLTPGTWRYGPGDVGTRASFGTSVQAVRFLVQCRPSDRAVVLATVGAPVTAMTVRTTSATRTLPLAAMIHADGWPPASNDARLAATDPLLDAIAFSRGRFVVEQPGAPPLVIPAHAEIGRVIEDCRG